MAFLDNSGDIILDAVLTDLGRKRMSEGNFRITQFALGDDEVVYSLYNKNHPSGSAYYDLEILQTPVFEAFTRTNANINYGLASYNGNQNLLYLPSMKLNTKNLPGVGNAQLRPTSNGVVYLAVDGTADSVLKQPGALGTATNFLLDQDTKRGLLIETGLDTQGSDALVGNVGTRKDYIVNNSLEDTQFTVKADSRIFSSIIFPNIGTAGVALDFTINAGSSINVSFSLNSSSTLNIGNQEIDYYGMATLPTKENKVYKPSGTTSVSDTDLSVINGPRAQVTAVGFELEQVLSGGSRDALYSQLGKIDQDLFSDGNTYDYIDTLVYFIGDVTGVTLQVPIRVIRKV
jgi:hypothetical protein